MADQIKGITVEIGGDVKGLNKSLSSVNKEIGGTQKELKEVERLLKLDPTNTDLLRQKQELLAKSIADTSAKVDALKAAKAKADENMANGTEVNQEMYRKLDREIAAGEASLKKLESQANSSDEAVKKIPLSADKIASSMENAANKTKVMSAAAGGVIAAMGGAAYKAITLSDDLNTLANQSGFTTADLQKMQYAADRIDVSMETITGASKKMKKNMVSSSKDTVAAWDAIGVSVRDNVTGELRDSTTVFYEAIDGLSKISNETERDTLAMQLFGKSADELAGVIDDGGAALKQYGKEAEDAGVILSQDTLDSLNKMNDAVDELKAQTTGTFAEVGAEVATMLTPFLKDLAGTLKAVLQWVRDLDQGQLKLIGTILLAVAAISPMLSIGAKLITIIKGTTVALTAIKGAIAIFTGAATTGSAAAMGLAKVIAALTAPITWAVAAVVAAVATIAVKGDEIQSILQKVDAFMQNIFARDWTTVFGPILGNVMNGFLAGFKSVWNAVQSVLNGIIDIIRGVFTGDWSRVWNGVEEVFAGVFNGLVSIAKAPLNGIIGLLNGAVGAINSLIGGFNRIGFTMPKWLGGGSWHPNLPNIPSIPYLAKGGTVLSGSAVVGEAGPELLTVLGNKTMVQPLTSQQKNVSYGGNVINVYGAPGQDVSQLAEIVADKINANVQQKGAAFA
ncbi:hypothetical protein [Pygmaiobacter massiliensis]|uniref:hypothetical protein n=1 Tax=Pygmaiobacter massiliensis TaxID=1917873 RepID=UPI000C7A10BA|nr:hypothetical protein [Pygmaiobacter massiliensis]